MDIEEIERDLEENKAKMTPSERSKKYFAGERVDHIPYSLHMPDQAVAQILGYKTTDLGKFEVFKEVKIYLRDKLGLGSGINHRLSLRTMGAAVESKLEFPENGIDVITDRVLEDYDDFYKIENLDPWNNEILTPLLEQGKRIREEMPEFSLSTGVVCPLSTAVAIRPIEKILKDTRKNKEEQGRTRKNCTNFFNYVLTITSNGSKPLQMNLARLQPRYLHL